MRKFFQTRSTEQQREAQLNRIMFVETNIMLPVKLAAILGSIYFYRMMMTNEAASPTETEAGQAYFHQLRFYCAGNLIFWILLLTAHLGQVWPRILRFSAFWLAMLDNLFLSGLIYFTGGLQSAMYWLYTGLMVRSAANFPTFWQQTVLNLSVYFFYTLAVVLREDTMKFFFHELYWLRLTILVLLGISCWGVYILIEREQRRLMLQQEIQFRTEKKAATDRLAAEIAHQLKNPLSIVNNAAFLLQRQAEKNASIPRETVGVIREEVARSDKILNDLMNYAHLSEGSLEEVDVNETLEQALAQARPYGLAENVQIVKHLAKDLPKMAIQRGQLEECFLNLLRNALEAMPEGGKLTVSSRHLGDGSIGVEVTDSGSGIPRNILPKVFDAFFTTKTTGTGLGLAIAKNMVERYGGTISAHSEVGRGSRFNVVLPVRIKYPR